MSLASPRIDLFRLARAAVLLGTGLVIAKLLVTGQMRYYVVASLDPLTGLTGALLVGMGLLELRAHRSDSGRRLELDGALTLGLLAVPLVLGLTFTPRALGTTSLGGTPVSRLVLAFDAGPPVGGGPPPTPKRPIADVADLLSYLRQSGESGVGQHVHLRGLVARSDEMAADEFVLLRYAIVHCVADAQPLGFLIVNAVMPTGGWTTDRWVDIDGTLASESRGSEHLVTIRADQVLPADEPPEPYVPAF